MSLRIILITGANGGLGQAIARSFLSESQDNFVWLGVRSRRDAADRLVTDFARRCRCVELGVTQAPSGQTNYAAAKAGVVALTQSLAKEVARLGITVNALCPGYVETDMIAGMSPEERKAALGRIPMRRFGRPEEIGAAVRFLACAD